MTRTTRVRLAGRQTRLDAGQQVRAIADLAYRGYQPQYADSLMLPWLAPEKARQSC
jgi:hypothetical protein